MSWAHLPAALKPKGVHMVSLVPGYPAVMAALEDAKPMHCSMATLWWCCSDRARQGRGPGRRRAGCTASVQPSRQPLSWPGRQGLARQRRSALPPCPALRRTSAKARSRNSCPTSCTCMTGRPHSPQPMCDTPHKERANPRPCSPCTTSPSRAPSVHKPSAIAGLPAHAYAVDGVEYYGSISFPERRPCLCRCHFNRQPHLCP